MLLKKKIETKQKYYTKADIRYGSSFLFSGIAIVASSFLYQLLHGTQITNYLLKGYRFKGIIQGKLLKNSYYLNNKFFLDSRDITKMMK